MQELLTNSQHNCYKLQTNGIIRFATLSEIVYLKSDGNYTHIFLKDLSQYTMCKTLQYFEMEFGFCFLRCHKTYLVNSEYIRELNKRNRHLILTTGESIPFSRNKGKILEDRMKKKFTKLSIAIQ